LSFVFDLLKRIDQLLNSHRHLPSCSNSSSRQFGAFTIEYAPSGAGSDGGQRRFHVKPSRVIARSKVGVFPSHFQLYMQPYFRTMKLSSIAARVASRWVAARLASFKAIKLRQRKEHLQPEDLPGSKLSDELKPKFSAALSIKKDFQRTIPISPKMGLDVWHVDRLQKQAGKTTFALEGLLDSVAQAKPEADLTKVRDTIRVLDKHGFVPSDEVSFEADSWGWTAHEVITELFDVATE